VQRVPLLRFFGHVATSSTYLVGVKSARVPDAGAASHR